MAAAFHSGDQATSLLLRAENGEAGAAEALFPIVYDELRGLAGRMFRSPCRGQTLQPTALVHEAYVRLIDGHSVAVSGRTHFVRLAAKAMREILVDHARRRQALKRGGHAKRVTMSSTIDSGEAESALDVLTLHEAIERLASLDERQAQVVELRFFGGMSVEHAAELLGVSPRTVELDWRVARAWLRRELGEEGGA